MKDKMMTPALIGGIILAGGSTIPVVNFLNCLCCAWLVMGGAAASYLYIKDSPVKVTTGDGAILGALAGVAGSVLNTLLSIPVKMLLPANTERLREMLDRPEIPEGLRSILASAVGRGTFSIVALFFGFVFMLILSLIFATLGGIIGVAIFEKRKNGAVVVPPPPMPPSPPMPPPTPPAAPPAL
ncbi:MAG TPA: hypothetical protein VGL91_21155 [Acidobacteriota bacterium]|jgi:hypothetical protein